MMKMMVVFLAGAALLFILTFPGCANSGGGGGDVDSTEQSPGPQADDDDDDDNDTGYHPADWRTDPIADGVSPEYCSLSLDNAEDVHVVFQFNVGQEELYYGKLDRQNNQWQVELVDQVTKSYTSIIVDEAGTPHLSYLDEDVLKYATKLNGQWLVENVCEEDVSGYSNTIVLDGSGRVVVGFSSSQGLKYAVRTNDGWLTTTILQDEQLGFCDFLIDPSGKMHLGYVAYNDNPDDTTYYVKYITNQTGAWLDETVEKLESICVSLDLALDETGAINLLYNDAEKNRLTIAARGDEGWRKTRVCRNGVVEGMDYDLTIESGGYDHYLYKYRDAPMEQARLRYVTNRSGKRQTSVVLEEGAKLALGLYHSLAVDGSGYAHLCFVSGFAGEGQFNYATNAPFEPE